MENTSDNGVRFRLLKLVQKHPDWSQRQHARAMGVSLGKLNYCLRALSERGFVKVGRFARSHNKPGYRYLLTPQGIAEKTQETARFLERKEREFEIIRREISVLKRELKEHEVQKSP